MHGADVSQPILFITRTVADFVPPDHPLRALRELIDEALASLDGLFDTLCTSVAPERLMRASLLQVSGSGPSYPRRCRPSRRSPGRVRCDAASTRRCWRSVGWTR